MRRYAEAEALMDFWKEARESTWGEIISSMEKFDQLANHKSRSLIAAVPRAYQPEAKRIYNLYIESLKERDQYADEYATALLSVYSNAERTKSFRYRSGISSPHGIIALPPRLSWETDPIELDKTDKEFLNDYEKNLRESGMKTVAIAEQLERLTGIKFQSGWLYKAGSHTTWKNSFFRLENKYKQQVDESIGVTAWDVIDTSKLKHAMVYPNKAFSDDTYDPDESSKTIDRFIFDNELSAADLPVGIRRLDDKKDKTFYESQYDLVKKRQIRKLNTAIDEYNSYLKQGYGTRRTAALSSFVRAEKATSIHERGLFGDIEIYRESKAEYKEKQNEFDANAEDLSNLIAQGGLPGPKEKLFELGGEGRLKDEYRESFRGPAEFDRSWPGFALIEKNESLSSEIDSLRSRLEQYEKRYSVT